MSVLCKYCIVTKGATLRDALDDDALTAHIEQEHDIPVAREGESKEQAIARFKAQNPRAGGPDCQCPDCMLRRGDGRLALVDLLTRSDRGGQRDRR